MLKIIDINTECILDESVAKIYPFPLYPFQKHGIKAIQNGENILCCALTGSGKTVLAEYAIHKTLANGGRIFYTTPIKSLSNQKFHDLKKKFPEASVSIITGDIKYNPTGNIVVMTTEILCNLLYKKNTITSNIGISASISLEGLQCVIFDECHFINDPSRGKIWEQSLILLDPKIQLICLSATIDKPHKLGTWLGKLKQVPLNLISTTYRIVPLVFNILIDNKPHIIMESNKQIFHDDVYRKYLQNIETNLKNKDKHKENVNVRRQGGYESPVVKSSSIASFPHRLNEAIRMFHEKELLPALFFVFSRALCEKYAAIVNATLITPSESAAIQHIWDFHLHRHKDILEHLPQAHTLLSLVKKGIAYHHSGILPILREMIEILFNKGMIKVLFATETLGIGVNLPSKTVVFLDLMKFTDEGNAPRLLRTDEFLQLSGRAGRSHTDKQGYVYYIPQRDPIDLYEIKSMMTGNKTPITSRMDFGYDFILKTLHNKNTTWMNIIEKSYWYEQSQEVKVEYQKNIDELELQISKIPITSAMAEQCKIRDALETTLKISINSAKKQAQREYNQWTNTHVGPQWENGYILYNSLKKLNNILDNAKEMLDIVNKQATHENLLGPRLSLLRKWNCIDCIDSSNKLLKRGVLATEINEGHPILMGRAYEEKLCSDFSHEELVGFLAAFMSDGKQSDDSPTIGNLHIPQKLKDTLYKIGSIAQQYSSEEYALLKSDSKEEYWNLDTRWIEPAYRWVSGESATIICVDNGIYEGNFMRSMLKLSNLVEEWTALATYNEDIEMLQKLEGLSEKIVRDITKPESLYLRL